jgi:magnesium chelatase family protein
LHVEVPRLNASELMNRAPGENSADVRERVVRARSRQLQRFGSEGVGCNAQLKARHLRELPLEDAARDLLKTAIHQFSLSARAYDRILKVAQTISDLDAADTIQLHHIAEAVNYRTLDRKLFSA